MEDFTGGGSADRESIGSGASDDKPCNGTRQTNGDISEETRPNKGSRRTTSLLNLFIPLSQGKLSIHLSSTLSTNQPLVFLVCISLIQCVKMELWLGNYQQLDLRQVVVSFGY